MRVHLLLILLLTFTACADPAAPGDAAPDAGADLAPDLTTEDSAPDLPPAKPLGATCTSDDQCAGGRCLLHPTWPSGYCTLPDCGAACDAAGGVCLSVRDGEPTCAKYCASVGECRFGYVCHRDWDTFDTGCLPQPLVPAPPPVVEPPPVMLNGASDGAPCAEDAECAGGTCLTGEAWPDGFCTTIGCFTDEQCKRRPDDPPVRCSYVGSLGDNACMSPCQATDQCREGYVCELYPPNSYFCAGATPFVDWVGPTPEATHGLRCQNTQQRRFTIHYTVPPDSPAHSITVVSPRGEWIILQQLTNPAATFNAHTKYRFWADLSLSDHRGSHTLIFPGVPQFANAHAPGAYSLAGTTHDPTICWRVDTHAGQGQRIQLAVFLVGRPEVTQIEALPELASLFAQINALLSPYGLSVEPQLVALPQELHDAYAYLRRDSEFRELAEQSGAFVPPELAMSVKLLLVRGFAKSNLLGRAGGLPGPPGIHRNRQAGVFASHASLGGDANAELELAQTITHELGHYLGLRHTTEGNGSTFDPIQDTPTCPEIASSWSCPDRFNIMFPYAGGAAWQNILTPDQLRSLRDNPLVRP